MGGGVTGGVFNSRSCSRTPSSASESSPDPDSAIIASCRLPFLAFLSIFWDLTYCSSAAERNFIGLVTFSLASLYRSSHSPLKNLARRCFTICVVVSSSCPGWSGGCLPSLTGAQIMRISMKCIFMARSGPCSSLSDHISQISCVASSYWLTAPAGTVMVGCRYRCTSSHGISSTHSVLAVVYATACLASISLPASAVSVLFGTSAV